MQIGWYILFNYQFFSLYWDVRTITFTLRYVEINSNVLIIETAVGICFGTNLFVSMPARGFFRIDRMIEPTPPFLYVHSCGRSMHKNYMNFNSCVWRMNYSVLGGIIQTWWGCWFLSVRKKTVSFVVIKKILKSCKSYQIKYFKIVKLRRIFLLNSKILPWIH